MNSLTRRSVLMTGAAAFALGGSNLETYAQQPKKGGTLQLRHQCRDAALRQPRQRHLRDAALRGAVLFDAAALQPRQIPRDRSRSRRLVAGRARPDDLHVQAPRPASNSMTALTSLPPTSRRATTACAIRRRASSRPARRPSTTSARSRRRIRTTVIFKMKAVNASMLEHFASPWNVIYAAKDLAADPNGPKTKVNGTGPFIFTEHVKGSHVSGKRNENYFKKGFPYLDGFKGVFTLQAAAMLNAAAGRTVARRIPRHLAGRARPPRAGDGRPHPHRGIELDAQPARLLQRREEAVRRRARAQGAADGGRPLGRQQRPVAHLDAAFGRRRDPSRLAFRHARGRTGQASRLLQGHQGVARGGQEAARRGGTCRT